MWGCNDRGLVILTRLIFNIMRDASPGVTVVLQSRVFKVFGGLHIASGNDDKNRNGNR